LAQAILAQAMLAQDDPWLKPCGERVMMRFGAACLCLACLLVCVGATCFEKEDGIQRHFAGDVNATNRCKAMFPIACFGRSYLWLGTPPLSLVDERPTSTGPFVWSAPHDGAIISAVLNLYTERRLDARANYEYAESSFRALLRSGIFQLRGAGESTPLIAHRVAKHLLPENYLWMGGLYLSHKTRAPPFTLDMTLVAMLFIERELFRCSAKAGKGVHCTGRSNSGRPVHVLVYCKFGLHRSGGVLVNYLTIKHVVMHHGLGGFRSLRDVWKHYQNITFAQRLRHPPNIKDKMYMNKMRLKNRTKSYRWYEWILKALRHASRRLSRFNGTLSYEGAEHRLYRPRNISALPMLLSSGFAHELLAKLSLSG